MTAQESLEVSPSSSSLSSESSVKLRKKNSISRLKDLIYKGNSSKNAVTVRPERRSLQEPAMPTSDFTSANLEEDEPPNPNFHRTTSESSNEVELLQEADEEGKEERALLVPELYLPEGKTLLDACFRAPASALFSVLFEDEDFLYSVGQRAYEAFSKLDFTSWKSNQDEEHSKERVMSYELERTVAGFARLSITVTQSQMVKEFKTIKGLLVNTVTRNSGVVYSDYFKIPVDLVFREECGNKTRLLVRGRVEFERGCFLRNRIESEAWQGMKKYFDVVAEELQGRFGLFDEEQDVGIQTHHQLSKGTQTYCRTVPQNVHSKSTISLGFVKNVMEMMVLLVLVTLLWRISEALIKIEHKL